MPAKGQTALYRPVPLGFDDLFIRVGWGSIEAETNAHAKTIRKWLDVRNEARAVLRLPSLQEARRFHVRTHGIELNPKTLAGQIASRSSVRYVLGRSNRRLRWPSPAPRFWDFGLLPGVAALAPEKPRRVMITPDRAAAIIEAAAKETAGGPEFLAGMVRAAELLRQQGKIA
jgi:hypothetical protein